MMARLDELLPEFKKEPTSSEDLTKKETIVNTGKKRRAWLIEDQASKEETYFDQESRELNLTTVTAEKGAINTVYKPEMLCYSDLRSNPLKLFQFLFELARIADNHFKTPRVKLREMMTNLNMSKDSARTALRFLLKQKFIQRIEFQPGKLGWSRYSLNEKIYKDLERGLSKGSIEPFTRNNNFTNINSSQEDLNQSWDEIDFSALESIGFNKKFLLQIKNKTTPEIVQESINHFAYSLKHNKKTREYSNPIAALITVLKRGEAWIEPNYQSPQEIARLKILELKKEELERKKQIEDELYNISFKQWQQTLTPEEIESLAPDNRKKGDPLPPYAKLSLYYRQHVWPQTKKM